MEFLVLIALAGYIYYLRNYADLRTRSEKEAARLREGANLLDAGKIEDAFKYFNEKIGKEPRSPVACLYRARCYMAMDDVVAAEKDLNAGLSYDDSVFGLHLELGKIYFQKNRYADALFQLDKAVLKSLGKDAESFHWRGLTHEKLNLLAEAKADFESENAILDKIQTDSKRIEPVSGKLLDRKLLANSLLTILTTSLLLWMIKHAESIHLPYLVAVASAVSLGFVEPYKGWVLAFLQCMLLWIGYTFLTSQPENTGQKELENFSLYGSIILTFAGSFLGAFFKRALNS
jgi:tetratricopeptide (TPR) repeat protein